MGNKRLHYIDNIRIALTAIVIIHHLLVSYGAPGGWYYKEFEFSQLDTPTLITLVLTTAVTQSYFMGFFFFLSGYFSAWSIQGEKTSRFITGRLARLGVPILLFVYLISPILRLVYRKIMFQSRITLEVIRGTYARLSFGTELGTMWFALLLLIFSITTLPFLKKDLLGGEKTGPLKNTRIIVFALCLGALTFIVRIFQPVGSVFQPLNLQLPHTVQYLFMFLAGVMAYHRNWLHEIRKVFSRSWIVGLMGLLLALPVVFILSGGLTGDVSPALGGMYWQSLFYSVWEQLMCVSVAVITLFYFQRKFDRSSPILKELSSSSYAAYLIHPLVLVAYTTLIYAVKIDPLLKIGVSVIPVLILCFLAAAALRRLPGLRRVL
jgi:glucan biosynthesis protein C